MVFMRRCPLSVISPSISQCRATNLLRRMTIARMKVTRQFIMDNRTPRGSWTQAQIEALGIAWPPRAGWIDGVIGHELTEAQVRQFQNKATKKQVKAGNAGQFDLF